MYVSGIPLLDSAIYVSKYSWNTRECHIFNDILFVIIPQHSLVLTVLYTDTLVGSKISIIV